MCIERLTGKPHVGFETPLHPSAYQIALRLALAFIVGPLIGLNRNERGHSAALRTNLLAYLAACIDEVNRLPLQSSEC